MQLPKVNRQRGRPRKVTVLPEQVAYVAPEPEPEYQGPSVPESWTLGALLNVRNAGSQYIITLFPEEYDPRAPDRAMRFDSYAETQDFVSRWYARTYPHPRAA
jgi:hypothetical protein